MTIDLPESSKVAKVKYLTRLLTLHYPRVALIATLSVSPAAASPLVSVPPPQQQRRRQ